MSEAIERVGVVGAGLMGAGIAEVAAKAGSSVIVCEMNAAAAAAGRDRIESSLRRAVERGKLDADACDEALARVSFVTDLHELADRPRSRRVPVLGEVHAAQLGTVGHEQQLAERRGRGAVPHTL